MLAVRLVEALLVETHARRHEQREREQRDAEHPRQVVLLVLRRSRARLVLRVRAVSVSTCSRCRENTSSEHVCIHS